MFILLAKQQGRHWVTESETQIANYSVFKYAKTYYLYQTSLFCCRARQKMSPGRIFNPNSHVALNKSCVITFSFKLIFSSFFALFLESVIFHL